MFTKQVSEDESTNNKGSTDTNYPDFDLRQARYDVRKFGIKGFDEMKKDEAMTSLLVSLGAKVSALLKYSFHWINVSIFVLLGALSITMDILKFLLLLYKLINC